MGIRSTLKKLVLPILGGNQAPPPPSPRPARAAPEQEPEEASPRGELAPDEYVRQTIAKHPIVLFMKGSPAAPQCGFSANAAGILSTYGRPIFTVNVLADEEIRSAVKKVTNWPTIPQIFIGGEFVGGSDILSEMHQNGELKTALDEAFSSADA